MRGPVAQRPVEPPPGLVGDDDGAEAGQHLRRLRVVRDHDHPAHLGAVQRGRHRVGRHRQRERGPVRPGEAGQARLGAGKYLDGDH
jgi:hypothetical protein